MFTILPICMGTDSFACQKLLSLKRKRPDQDQGQKERVFTRFPALPEEIQRYVIGKVDFNSLSQLQLVSKKTRADLQVVSQQYITFAEQHAAGMKDIEDQFLLRAKDGLSSPLEKTERRDIHRKLISINSDIEMAKYDHVCKDFDLSISCSRKALSVPIPQAPQDVMMVDKN